MRNSFTLTYILLTVGQMILSNYFHFTPYVMLTILPAMVLCIPTKTGTVKAMLIAFVTGLAVDFFAEGTLGINALSSYRSPCSGSLSSSCSSAASPSSRKRTSPSGNMASPGSPWPSC